MKWVACFAVLAEAPPQQEVRSLWLRRLIPAGAADAAAQAGSRSGTCGGREGKRLLLVLPYCVWWCLSCVVVEKASQSYCWRYCPVVCCGPWAVSALLLPLAAPGGVHARTFKRVDFYTVQAEAEAAPGWQDPQPPFGCGPSDLFHLGNHSNVQVVAEVAQDEKIREALRLEEE